LPLLDRQALSPDEERSLREHLAGCAWCQSELAAYRTVQSALVRQYSSLPSAHPLTLEDIMRRSEYDTQPATTDRPANRYQPGRSDRLSDVPRGASPGASYGGGGGQKRATPWAAIGAVAAALLIVVLATAVFAALRLQTPGITPASSCSTALPGGTSASAISGFSALTFPAGAVTTTVTSSQGGLSQFTILETDVCYSGAADDLTGPASAHHSVTANLLGAGWSASSSFPTGGALLQPCASQCYQMANTRYLALEQITDHGSGVFTYHLRLAAPPAAPTCNANFANSPIHGVQTVVEGVPLPPTTFVVPDNAAGLHGYDLCSSGTAASVSAFLTGALPTSNWTKVASDPRCFYQDQCWTKGSNAISWQVADPTDWHVAYHPATA
jgi:hypothetical protein